MDPRATPLFARVPSEPPRTARKCRADAAAEATNRAGAASALINATQHVGGSLGFSILATISGTASKNEAEKHVPKFLADGAAERKAQFARAHQLPDPCSHDVLSQGIATAFVPTAAMAALALVTV